MKLKKFAAFGLAAVTAMSMTACSSSSSSTSESTTGSDNATSAPATTGDASGSADKLTYKSVELGKDYKDLTTTIKFIHHKTDRESDGTMAKLIAEFNKEYPNIKVETEGVTDYAQDSLLRLTTGDWGDIMFIPAVDKKDLPTYFLPYGTTEEVGEFVNFPKQWEQNGEAYGIGYMGNAQGVLYNKKVFADAGVDKVPTTPAEFISALEAISEKTDAIPLYTNYAAGWTMGAWDAYIGITTNGDNTYMNQKFVHDADPFKDPGDGTGIYNLYKILYDATEKKLIEDDYTTTDWEGCKARINNGEIGTMVLGSWAIAQMKAAGDHADDIGYMPFPITVDGKQYASAGPDYCYGINAKADADHQAASMVFVKWMVEKSGWCELEGGYPISKTAPTSFAFDSAVILSDESALEGEADFLNEMNAESELSFNQGGDKKVQRIVEAAATGSESFDDIMKDWTEKWTAAQEANKIEAK